MSAPAMPYLEQNARPFPFHVLEGCDTGLCLFSGAFHGMNDAVHFAMSGVQTTCVDIDGEKLREMRDVYPKGWSFIEADAWTFAQAARDDDLVWDAVCADPFRGDAMDRSMETLDLWLALAERVLIAGTTTFPFVAPASWNVATKYVERVRGTYWLVLERNA